MVGHVSWVHAFALLPALCSSEHHMKWKLEERASTSTVPLLITNSCASTIYPGIETQAGTGPASQGFELTSGSSKNQTVSSDWQGRVWGRTNCTFNDQGTSAGGGAACDTGDCGGVLVCTATGSIPVTLAEFTLNGSSSQTFYDISLVDGYNLPLAIVTINPSTLAENEANPSCVATEGLLAAPGSNLYANGEFLGTTSSDPITFEETVTNSFVASWCPWDLQAFPPAAPGNGVYPYPDTDIARPAFDPCYSACAKYDTDAYCCTGSYDTSATCGPNYYSKLAKEVCPDAYSYAYDDATSTFITDQGPGFEVIFCPGGRSTDIHGAATSSANASGSRRGFKSTHPILDFLAGNGGRATMIGLLAVTVTAMA